MVDALLREHLDLLGLSDTGKTPGKNDVVILDPSAGTGVFLHEVLRMVCWCRQDAKYIRESLLPRMMGFEILPELHAIAYLTLGLELYARGFRWTHGGPHGTPSGKCSGSVD